MLNETALLMYLNFAWMAQATAVDLNPTAIFLHSVGLRFPFRRVSDKKKMKAKCKKKNVVWVSRKKESEFGYRFFTLAILFSVQCVCVFVCVNIYFNSFPFHFLSWVFVACYISVAHNRLCLHFSFSTGDIFLFYFLSFGKISMDRNSYYPNSGKANGMWFWWCVAMPVLSFTRAQYSNSCPAAFGLAWVGLASFAAIILIFKWVVDLHHALLFITHVFISLLLLMLMMMTTTMIQLLVCEIPYSISTLQQFNIAYTNTSYIV